MSFTVKIYGFLGSFFSSLFGSGGFWGYLKHDPDPRDDEELRQLKQDMNNTKAMLVGLGHDRIVTLALDYIERGSITRDEFENLHDYLYVPYKNLNGNGTAEKLMNEVKRLKTTKEKIQ